jgi:hypothetical protein
MRDSKNQERMYKNRIWKREVRGGKSEIELINWANNPKNYRRF